MTKGTADMNVLMGDVVLTQDEVSPVMSAEKLATGFKAALAELGKPAASTSGR